MWDHDWFFTTTVFYMDQSCTVTCFNISLVLVVILLITVVTIYFIYARPSETRSFVFRVSRQISKSIFGFMCNLNSQVIHSCSKPDWNEKRDSQTRGGNTTRYGKHLPHRKYGLSEKSNVVHHGINSQYFLGESSCRLVIIS